MRHLQLQGQLDHREFKAYKACKATSGQRVPRAQTAQLAQLDQLDQQEILDQLVTQAQLDQRVQSDPLEILAQLDRKAYRVFKAYKGMWDPRDRQAQTEALAQLALLDLQARLLQSQGQLDRQEVQDQLAQLEI